MSSPDLLHTQLDRWINAYKNKAVSSIGDTKVIEKEVLKLKDQEGRYNKGYGAGLFTAEQLKEYTTPIKERIASLEAQIAKVKQQENQISTTAVPDTDEIKSFAEESVMMLADLSFELKRAIVTKVVEKIVGTREKLEVSGYLPISSNYVAFKTSNRYRRSAKCGQVDSFQCPHTPES